MAALALSTPFQVCLVSYLIAIFMRFETQHAHAQATPPQFGVDWLVCLLHAIVGVVVGLEQRRTLGRGLFQRRPQCEPHASRRVRVRCTGPCTSICHAAGNLARWPISLRISENKHPPPTTRVLMLLEY